VKRRRGSEGLEKAKEAHLRRRAQATLRKLSWRLVA
jgi:hypothetical protein